MLGRARSLARVNVALVGAGNIAAQYAQSIADEPRLTLAGVTDLAPERAAELARRFDVDAPRLARGSARRRRASTPSSTSPRRAAHATVTAACLDAGKHVHTEKPVAIAYDEARALAERAERRGVRLSCAPATLLGEAQQTAWKLVREGALGEVRVAYAEANWGRIESLAPIADDALRRRAAGGRRHLSADAS